MDIKYILFICLILAILTTGIASASQDIVYDDLNEIDDNKEDIVPDSQDNDLNYEENGIDCKAFDVDLSDEDVYIVYFYCSDDEITGNLSVYVGDDLRYNELITSSNYEQEYCELYITPEDLKISKQGNYDIMVLLDDLVLEKRTIHAYGYSFTIMASNYEDYDASDTSFSYGDTIYFTIGLPENITNKLTLTVNGKTYNVNYTKGTGVISVNTLNWNLGEYNVIANYTGDDKYPTDSVNKIIYINPKVEYPYAISVGENEFVSFTIPNVSNDMQLIIYKFDEDYVEVASQKIDMNDGYGTFSLASLSEGDYKFLLDYNVGNYKDNLTFNIMVYNNSEEFNSIITPTELFLGEDVLVKVTGPESEDMLHITIDDKLIKSSKFLNGVVEETFNDLSIGTHKFTVYFNNYKYFYSNTVYITVKQAPIPIPTIDPTPIISNPKITLKLNKVTIKKFARKLEIKATLKLDGKTKKGLKLIFKFNNKKYTAKTNSNGIAKITIKKTVLKKLKIGRKVTYQVSYNNKSVKKTVKVKK